MTKITVGDKNGNIHIREIMIDDCNRLFEFIESFLCLAYSLRLDVLIDDTLYGKFGINF